MKKFSVLLSFALMVLLLIPASSTAAQAYTITDVTVTDTGGNYKMKIGTYGNLIDLGKASRLNVGFVTSSDGKTYGIKQYSQALDISYGNITSTLDMLNRNGTALVVESNPAVFDTNGNLIPTNRDVFEVVGIE